MTSLASLVEAVARRTPKALAVTDRSDSLTYGELSTASARAAASLENLGVGNGARVGILTDKSVGAVAAMQGVLRIGAAYVPLDAQAPAARIRAVALSCGGRSHSETGTPSRVVRNEQPRPSRVRPRSSPPCSSPAKTTTSHPPSSSVPRLNAWGTQPWNGFRAAGTCLTSSGRTNSCTPSNTGSPRRDTADGCLPS